jgi:microcystin-dependent protein
MAEPFLSEIRMVSFNFAAKGWALCNGQFLPINQNQALFALLGTTYGGDGQTTFRLPDLRGRAPIHEGSSHTLGERAGEEAHTLTSAEMPGHSHVLRASQNNETTEIPDAPLVLASSAPSDLYTGFAAPVALAPQTVTSIGGSLPHENRQPFLVINYMIALQGIFPSQN